MQPANSKTTSSIGNYPDYKLICNRLGCNSKATVNIQVNLGNRKLSLYFCSDCREKFQQD
jgi:transposase-like protein